jgi:hypothetical protein
VGEIKKILGEINWEARNDAFFKIQIRNSNSEGEISILIFIFVSIAFSNFPKSYYYFGEGIFERGRNKSN